jgi:hypothetical protein
MPYLRERDCLGWIYDKIARVFFLAHLHNQSSLLHEQLGFRGKYGSLSAILICCCVTDDGVVMILMMMMMMMNTCRKPI